MKIHQQKVILLIRIVFNIIVIIYLYLHLVLPGLNDHILIHNHHLKIKIQNLKIILHKVMFQKILGNFNLMTEKIVF